MLIKKYFDDSNAILYIFLLGIVYGLCDLLIDKYIATQISNGIVSFLLSVAFFIFYSFVIFPFMLKRVVVGGENVI